MAGLESRNFKYAPSIQYNVFGGLLSCHGMLQQSRSSAAYP